MAPEHGSHEDRTSRSGPNTTAEFEAEALPHLDALYRAAASILRSRTEAEDAVQETYLQALRSFRRFTPGTNCRAWLFRILFHVISHQRRKWLGRFIFSEREELDRQPSTVPPYRKSLPTTK